MKSAIPFIVWQSNTIKIEEEAKRRILEFAEENIEILSIIGVYRTGKSSILNQLLDAPSCFNRGETTDACTKGIWMYSICINRKDNKG